MISPENHTNIMRQVFSVNIQVNIQDMQSMTISVEESALAWAEIEAKRRNCSVSVLLGQLLQAKMLSEVAEKQLHSNAALTKYS